MEMILATGDMEKAVIAGRVYQEGLCTGDLGRES